MHASVREKFNCLECNVEAATKGYFKTHQNALQKVVVMNVNIRKRQRGVFTLIGKQCMSKRNINVLNVI